MTVPYKYNPNASLNQGTKLWLLADTRYDGQSVWPDISGNGHDGTLTNMDPETDWVTDSPPGGFGALTFGGANGHVAIPEVDSETPTFTILVRIRLDSVPTDFVNILNSEGTSNPYQYYIESGATYSWLRRGGGDELRDGSNPLPLSVFAFTSLTYDGTTFRQFLDGVQTGAVSYEGGLITDIVPTSIGLNAGITVVLPAALSDIHVYNRALTAQEVAAYYAESLAGYPTTLLRGGSRRPRLFVP